MAMNTSKYALDMAMNISYGFPIDLPHFNHKIQPRFRPTVPRVPGLWTPPLGFPTARAPHVANKALRPQGEPRGVSDRTGAGREPTTA